MAYRCDDAWVRSAGGAAPLTDAASTSGPTRKRSLVPTSLMVSLCRGEPANRAVLNDEVSRKYIQGLKRLMTFAQSQVRRSSAERSLTQQYPPADISKLMG